tara:strand:+ start:1254 stop:2345 length:1092 start_codon:yes stop_codon:yes gene_type:complete
MVIQEENRIKRVAVIGIGVIGELVVTMLRHHGFEVTAVDERDVKTLVPVRRGDIRNQSFLSDCLSDCDAVVSCVPYHLTKCVVEAALLKGIHYFDATEDVEVTNFIRRKSGKAKGAMVPQCGLAPGFIGIVASHLAKGFDDIESIKMRVGALPQNPTGKLGYAINWSVEGVVNEYIEDCDIIKEGKHQKVAALGLLETLRIKGTEYEAFTTSGGLGTMTETFKDRAKNLDYKSIRFPGHCEQIEFLMNELQMRDKRWELMKILKEALPPCDQDKVLVYASVTGRRSEGAELETVEFVREYAPKVIKGRSYKAIAWTTGAAIVTALQLVDLGHLPQKGFVKQEQIPYEKFIWSEYGKLYVEEEK